MLHKHKKNKNFHPFRNPDNLHHMGIINLLYSSIVIIAVFGYVPQIYKLWRSKTDGTDISITTWLLWLYTWIISLIYGVFELGDLKFCIVAIINLIGHITIITLTLHNRKKFKTSKQIAELE